MMTVDALGSFRRCGLMHIYVQYVCTVCPKIISEMMETNGKEPKGTLMRESLKRVEDENNREWLEWLLFRCKRDGFLH